MRLRIPLTFLPIARGSSGVRRSKPVASRHGLRSTRLPWSGHDTTGRWKTFQNRLGAACGQAVGGRSATLLDGDPRRWSSCRPRGGCGQAATRTQASPRRSGRLAEASVRPTGVRDGRSDTQLPATQADGGQALPAIGTADGEHMRTHRRRSSDRALHRRIQDTGSRREDHRCS